ncbi:SH3 domain-containing protein [Aquibacillus halophilus]|uniref:SH3 domain-containing protein n=1 Tax=Aquibacillus halophilus TaxID=930132 RepID=A0A6A8DBM9_9BACI|nr:SH3 domain-containing protein [Aquibacillus halophilus]MRH41171.1 SH3 domain-containing protein [Aquibacillus halophilus]
MEIINDLVFDVWKHLLGVPIYIRQVLFLFLVVFIIRYILIKVIPFIIKTLIHLISFLLNQWVNFNGWFLNLWMKSRRKRDKGIPGIINIMESIMDLTTEGTTRLKRLVAEKPKFKTKFKKTYKWVAIIIIIGFPFLYYSQPQLEVSKKWDDVEGWVVGHSLTETPATTSAKEEKNQEGNVKVSLREGYDGVYIREKPSLDAKDLEILGVGEQATYLNQEQQVEDITWLYVELKNGKKGWVSNKIVERHQ